MGISSPFVVVPVIVAVFFVCIFWGTSSKEDASSEGQPLHPPVERH